MSPLPFTFRRRMHLVQHIAFTNAFHVENVNQIPDGSTTAFVDSAASSQMVSADSRISQHVVETTDCNMLIKQSCCTLITIRYE